MHNHVLITFEGIDGSGKSTQIRMLENRLHADGYGVTVVREPGGTALSEHVRSLLLQEDVSIAPFTELLLFSAARAQLCREVIRPRLDAGDIVICDRFTDSTLAYQGGGRSAASIEWLREFNEHVTGGLVPDRTYYLAVEPETALARGSGRDRDRMESSGADFYDRVIDAYERLAGAEPSRIRRMDAGADATLIHVAIWADILDLLPARNREAQRR